MKPAIQTKSDMIQYIILHVGLFFGLIAILWSALSFSAMIPNESLKDNYLKSASYYKEIEPFTFYNDNTWNAIGDNYADVILMGVSWQMGEGENAFFDVIDSDYYDGEGLGENTGLYLSVSEGRQPNEDYTRYWHGTSLFIRLFHLFTDVNGVKLILFGLIILFLCLTNHLLIRQKHLDIAILLTISTFFVHIWNVRLSLEYEAAFLVAFLMCPLFLWLERKDNKYLTLLSIASGTLVAFFDFLTNETLTILIPLILVISIRHKEKRLTSFKGAFLLIIKCGLCWGLAYVGTFIMKWLIASIITGENSFITALTSAAVRIGVTDELGGIDPDNFLTVITANLTMLFGGTARVQRGRAFLGLGITLGILGSIWYLFKAKKTEKDVSLLLLFLGSIVLLRYIILNNHSYVHEFFTYRALMAPILSLLLVLYFNIELPNKGVKK